MADSEKKKTEFDFGKLTPEATELPQREGGRTREVEDNPFIPWVQESYNSETGRAVTVPNEMVKKTEYLIRQAAKDLGLGVRIVTSLTKEEMTKAAKNRNVKVSFQGQKKRNYSPRKRKGETLFEQSGETTGADAQQQ